MVPLSRAQFTFRLVRPTAVPKDNPVVSFNFGRRTVSDYSARRIKSERDEGGEDDYGKKKNTSNFNNLCNTGDFRSGPAKINNKTTTVIAAGW